MKDKKMKTSIRAICIIALILCFFVLVISVNMAAALQDTDFEQFSFRFACTDENTASIAAGSLVTIKHDGKYASNSIIQYESIGGDIVIGTAAYATDMKEYIGVVTSAIPVAGRLLYPFAQSNLLISLTFVLFVLILCVLVRKRNGSRIAVYQGKRGSLSAIWIALTNSYLIGFAKGTIYTGSLKQLCVPGLSCYSCPGAYGACPVGALQAVFTKRSYKTTAEGLSVTTPFHFSFYVVGFVMIIGALSGRLTCGFLCPFGFAQELLYRIPVKKTKIIKADSCIRYVKYVILVLFVVLLPQLLSSAFPWFCKLICPSGMLMGGLPLIASNEGVASATGVYTVIKLCVLAAVIIASVLIYRPFCKYICPLGALYGLLNKISLLRFGVDKNKCTNCGQCIHVCKMGVNIIENPRSAECIRCGDCAAACASKAIRFGAFGISVMPSVSKTHDK